MTRKIRLFAFGGNEVSPAGLTDEEGKSIIPDIPMQWQRTDGGSTMSDNALSRTTFWLMLLVHCIAGVVLFATPVGFVPKFDALFENLRQRGELPLLTVFVMLLSRCWYWLQ